MNVVSEGSFSCLNYIWKFEPIAHILSHYIIFAKFMMQYSKLNLCF